MKCPKCRFKNPDEAAFCPACHAALAIQKAIGGCPERSREQHGAEFKMRIGLNSGPVVVGAIGDGLRMDYTVD